MTIRANDQLVSLLLSGRTFPAVFGGGDIQIYAGAMPSDPTLVPPNPLLGVVRDSDGGHPTYELQGTVIGLSASKNWTFDISAIGVPTFARFVPNGAYPGAAMLSDQIAFPEFTSTEAQIDLTTFFFTLQG